MLTPNRLHRHSANADIYFVVNQTDAPVHIDGRFRVDGRDVQVLRPMDGAMTDDKPGETAGYTTVAGILDRSGNRQPGIEPAAYITGSGFTEVPLDLAERESVFVVFRDVAAGPARSASTPVWTRLTALTGPLDAQLPVELGRAGKRADDDAHVMDRQLQWASSTSPAQRRIARLCRRRRRGSGRGSISGSIWAGCVISPK
jgi:hypothetical protein